MPQYYLQLTDNLEHMFDTYQLGLNQIKTSIHYFDQIHITAYKKLAYVHVPDGIQIHPTQAYRTVSAVYIDRVIDIVDHPEYHQICLNSVSVDPHSISYISAERQTLDVCRMAISNYPETIVCIVNKTAELCKMSVRRGCILGSIPYVFQTMELCEIAIRRDGDAIRYVRPELMTARLCMLAVRQNGNALRSVPAEFKTYDLCVAAVARNPRAVQFL